MAGMDGRSVATKVTMLAVMTEGPWNNGLRRRRVAWRRWVAMEG